MKRVVSVLLVMILCVAFCLPIAVSGAEEYSKLDKSTYMYGEYMELIYKFAERDGTRWVCIYKDSVATSNMVYTYPATEPTISGYYLPQQGVPVNGYQKSNAFEPGSYIAKVMYIPEGGNYMDANNFSTGVKSDITFSFTVTANSATTPTISIADREIEKNGNLTVAYSGISYDLDSRSLDLVVTNQSGKIVKKRALFNINHYEGISGETTIALTGLEPGTYKVGFTCDDATYTIAQQPIEITVTEQTAGGTEGVFPEDLLKNKDICGRYFTNADNVYETLDGEYVMTVPHHMGFDYMYTWEPIPYDTFTVSFDFLLHIAEDTDSQIADEMDFLFGVSEDGKNHHQLTVGNTSGTMTVNHWKREGDGMAPYAEDNYFYDFYDEEMWYSISVQITKEDVTVFLDGEEILTLTESANCTGENGRIGLRGGSQGGFKIKNLKVAEGLYTEEEATSTPDATQTPAPTQTPVNSSTPVPTSTSAQNETNEGSYIWIVALVAVVVVACGCGTVFVIIKKKK